MLRRFDEWLTRARRLCLGLALTGALGMPGIADAQSRPARERRVEERLLKAAPALLKAGQQLAARSGAATVRLMKGDRATALGVIVRDDGVILTKASEVDDGVEVELPGGQRLPARVVGVAPEHDLAALKVEATGLPVVEFDAATARQVDPGQWLLSPAAGGEALMAVGNVSVGALRRIPGSGSLLGVALGEEAAGIPIFEVDPQGAADRAGLAKGDLILAVDGVPVGRMRDLVRTLRNGPPDAEYTLTVSRDGEALETRVRLSGGSMGVTLVSEAAGVPVDQVTPNSGAAAAGIQPGDLILSIDDTPVRDRQSLMDLIRRHSPGEQIDVTILRNGEEDTRRATLGYRSARSPRGDIQNSLGTLLSNRAVDFPAVIQHDTVLNANQMGGPIIDLEGRVLGINIARAGRVETYALPAGVIRQVLPQLLSGKLSPATGPAQSQDGEPMEQQPLSEDGAGQ